MEEIRSFNNQDFGEVRTIMIDGEPWFVGKDVASALGYTKTDGMTRLIDDDDKRTISSADLGEQVYKQTYTIGIINESGLYAAIFGSKLDSAKKFKRWVTSEILPSIRRNGSYGTPLTTAQQIQLLAQGNVELNQKVDTLSDRMDKFEQDLPLFPGDADELSHTVKKRVTEALGGKNSNAYHDKSISQSVFMDAYRNLKYNFGVSSYKRIKRYQKEIALRIAREYQPPVFLEERIRKCNSQINLNI